MSDKAKRFFEFGPFRLDAEERVLLRDGEPVQLTQKAFETLYVLVEKSGRVLEKDELMRRIWPDSFVEEATLAQNIFTLRKVLGETPDKNRYIETVPRRGYRFVAQVKEWSPGIQSSFPLRHASTARETKSIAVLPFKPLTANEEDKFFGLGMADALITKLSNIRSITVRPTSAVLKFSSMNEEPIAAGRKLIVEFVLDGRIQRSGDRIRVTAQLVDLETESPLWADKFDEKFVDIFTVQDTISERLVEAMMVQLTIDEKKLLAKHHTTNSEAYRLYLQGRFQWNKWTRDGFEKSISCFNRVIDLDPDYALAYAGLSDAYNALAFYGYVSPQESMPQAKAAALRALDIDESLAEAHISLASVHFFYDWDWKATEQAFKRAIELNPAYATAHQGYGLFLVAMRRFDEAIARLGRALEADPVSLLINTTMGFPYFFSGKYDQALELYTRALEVSREFGLTYASIADVYVQKGMFREAIGQYQKAISILGETPDLLSSLAYAYARSSNRALAIRIANKLRRMARNQYISSVALSVVQMGLGDRVAALEFLEDGYATRSNRMVYLGVHPVFNSLRSDARFIDLLDRMRLAD
jgi:DNA-binding winged helix-turn-helix (wHTH) protein/tetratricopeptide (TPR) repeat protein